MEALDPTVGFRGQGVTETGRQETGFLFARLTKPEWRKGRSSSSVSMARPFVQVG